MKVFTLISIEDYKEFLEYIINQDQPIYVYEENEKIIVSEKEIENFDEDLLNEDNSNVELNDILDDILDQNDLDELADFFDNI